jgi:hypothetical protein
LFTFWPPLKAVNQESQQSRASGALCFVVTSIGGSICFSSRIDGWGLLSARDHSPLWFTSGKFCWGAVNFPNHSRIPLKDTKAVILTALKRLCLP